MFWHPDNVKGKIIASKLKIKSFSLRAILVHINSQLFDTPYFIYPLKPVKYIPFKFALLNTIM
jgi:hypothetical protein